MLLLAPLILATSTTASPPLRTLIVGGGPSLKYNQVAIESNVRYVSRLLQPANSLRILFADGKPETKDVLFTNDRDKAEYRAPDLIRLDGPAQKPYVGNEMTLLANPTNQDKKNPALIYFTGHGSGDARTQFANNHFDLWNEGAFSVKDFAKSLTEFSKDTPVTIVMVECFSGAFGNLLFEGGEPDGGLIDKQICGFFASIAQRPAAGCTPEVNEANYRDYTSYFFAALTGTDRLGKSVTGADYDHNGKVGMNEAYIYTLIHDVSIDTPVCTSDVFVRRFVVKKDEEIFDNPYSKVLSWASTAQKAGLEQLSQALHLDGETRLRTAFDKFLKTNFDSEEVSDAQMIRYVRLAKSIVLAHFLNDGNDGNLKRRYASLTRSEGANPFAN